ncbi:MAG: hypothetical protein JWL90_4478 [Chthoniobacteraceae bacterium]|nr:hypothetical protein [Chthoniobacteraceae bacterium]MDB6171634.1 hypothetical protein [Chthoniobacteraceae bacterium]
MAFNAISSKSGKSYVLHAREQTLRGGHTTTLYYFAGKATELAIDAVPAGYYVSEAKTGLPVLKKTK